MTSCHRILRKNSDATSFYNHVYLYDGLFDVVSLCKAVGNSGFVVWKYLLQRRASQPESLSKPVSSALLLAAVCFGSQH